MGHRNVQGQSHLDIVSGILAELARIKGKSRREISEADSFILPRMLYVTENKGIIINAKIDSLIAGLALGIKSNSDKMRHSFSDKDIIGIVRDAIGPALAGTDLAADREASGKAVLARIKEAVSASTPSDAEHYFGTTLFGADGFTPLRIGPVVFETKNAWLDRISANPAVSKTTHARLKRLFARKKIKKRRPGYDASIEWGIIEAVGESPYICSVAVRGLASNIAEERAALAARLALTAIALNWGTPSTALSGLNLSYDGDHAQRFHLSFTQTGRYAMGGSRIHMSSAPYIDSEDWQSKEDIRTQQFSMVGQVLDYLVSADRTTARPHMMATLCQALLWFHEACRDGTTLMSIVKFCACMDALGTARQEAGIRDLLEARLGIKPDDKITASGITMKKLVAQIYGEGRSQTVHGANSRFDHDWSTMKRQAESLARLCLLASLQFAFQNPDVVSPSELSRKQKTANPTVKAQH